MKGSELIRLVDQMHHDKNIKRDLIFEGIESAIQLAALKHFGEETDVVVTIDRETGDIQVVKDGEEIDPAVLGRIPAQSAKNVMIQKIREAESTAVFNEYTVQKGELVYGDVRRHETGATIVTIGKTEAILPRSEQIPGETYHINDRLKAVILEVKKVGQRVKIVLSRTHADFVRRLFENEIPEIQDRIIEIKAVAREAGYRTKIAVSSIDLKVDCVGACVGVRGSRIKVIVDELGGERIDIVRWNDSLQVMIPNALQPAEIEEVFLYPRPGRAIVLVQEDQLSLAIGRRGQNVRLASKLVGWDIEIMTHDELNESIEKSELCFRAIPGVTDEMVEAFIEEGFMSFDDLAFTDAAELMEICGIEEEQAQAVIDFAEDISERMERGEEIEILPEGDLEEEEKTEADEPAAEITVEEGSRVADEAVAADQTAEEAASTGQLETEQWEGEQWEGESEETPEAGESPAEAGGEVAVEPEAPSETGDENPAEQSETANEEEAIGESGEELATQAATSDGEEEPQEQVLTETQSPQTTE